MVEEVVKIQVPVHHPLLPWPNSLGTWVGLPSQKFKALSLTGLYILSPVASVMMEMSSV